MVQISKRFLPLLFAVAGSLEFFVNAAAVSSASDLEAPVYGQCGGNGYSGPAVCPKGYECDPVNEGECTKFFSFFFFFFSFPLHILYCQQHMLQNK